MTRSASSLLLVIGGLITGLLVMLAALPALREISKNPPRISQPPVVRQPVALPPLTEHALLHAEAQEVHTFLSLADTGGCKWDCSDGRTRYACFHSKVQGWAFAVVEAGVTITAFFTDQDYAVGHTRDFPGCSNPFHGAHP
jgi:hypothetical protein